MRKPRKFADGGTLTADQKYEKRLQERRAAQEAAAETRKKAAAEKEAARLKAIQNKVAKDEARKAELKKAAQAKEADRVKRVADKVAQDKAKVEKSRQVEASKSEAIRKAGQAKEAAKEKAIAERTAKENAAVEAKRQAGLKAEAAKEKFVAERSAREDAAAEMKRKAGEAKEAAKAKFVAERSAKEDAAAEAKRQAGLKAEEAKAKFAEERAAKAPSAPARPAGISAIPQSIAEQQALFDKRIAQAAALPPEQRAKFAEQFQRAAASGDPSTVRPQSPDLKEVYGRGPSISKGLAPLTTSGRLSGPLGSVPAPSTNTPGKPMTLPKGVAGDTFQSTSAAPKPFGDVIKGLGMGFAPPKPAVTQPSAPRSTQSFGQRTTASAQPSMQQRAATSGMAPKPGFVTVKPAAGAPPAPFAPKMKKGGAVKGYAKGGKVSSASSRGDGIAQRGKTKGRIC